MAHIRACPQSEGTDFIVKKVLLLVSGQHENLQDFDRAASDGLETRPEIVHVSVRNRAVLKIPIDQSKRREQSYREAAYRRIVWGVASV